MAVAIALAGCGAGATMTNMWNDAAYTARPLHDVLVVAVRKDPARRRLWEDAFVADLKARGVSATASYTLWDAVPDTDQVISAVREKKLGAVIASARLEPGEETTVVPGYIRQDTALHYNPWTNRYHTYFHDVVVPDRVETTTIQRFRTDVWVSGEGGQLVWTGTLNVSEAPNRGLIEKNVSKGIVPEMEKVGLVPKRT
jgi:hypothetical protein